MRHRDFDGVTLVLWQDDDGWLLTDDMDQPVLPLRLFFRGGDAKPLPGSTKAVWTARATRRRCPSPPRLKSTTAAEKRSGRSKAHLNVPLYLRLEEAKLGMEMELYFERVELTDWADPTETQPVSFTFHFYRSNTEAVDGTTVVKIDVDDLSIESVFSQSLTMGMPRFVTSVENAWISAGTRTSIFQRLVLCSARSATTRTKGSSFTGKKRIPRGPVG